ncbi:hypothetical protein I4U23_010293 [Adineta vaga]|nr:hypothetical protein I4U23_010293 [Adineta vaga]
MPPTPRLHLKDVCSDRIKYYIFKSILELDSSCRDDTVIRKVYLAKVKQYHSDSSSHDSKRSHTKFNTIEQAYGTLTELLKTGEVPVQATTNHIHIKFDICHTSPQHSVHILNLQDLEEDALLLTKKRKHAPPKGWEDGSSDMIITVPQVKKHKPKLDYTTILLDHDYLSAEQMASLWRRPSKKPLVTIPLPVSLPIPIVEPEEDLRFMECSPTPPVSATSTPIFYDAYSDERFLEITRHPLIILSQIQLDYLLSYLDKDIPSTSLIDRYHLY